ncbi:MAG: helix-turn-helix transcriptional regulator [Clostridiales bacterium]|jgi:transcriptional regulator with XRE-family HTH domain|nr:helix-turn-helix transcriptional regulator [Clostridiales bacterium]
MKTPAIPVINRRILEIRSALGLSQIKFSTIVAMSNGYIAGIETGRIAVNERLIKLVCSSFNVSEAWLRYGEGDMFLETLPDDKRFKNLVSMVKGLPAKYQDFLFQVLDMLLKLKDK